MQDCLDVISVVCKLPAAIVVWYRVSNVTHLCTAMLAKSSLTVLINHPAPIPHLSWAPARDCCVHCTALFEPLAVGPGNPSPNIARIWDEPPPQPLHCTTMFSSPICTVCCTVSCTVYANVHCCTPGSIEDSEVQYCTVICVQCTPHTAVRPGTIEDTSPPPLSLSMTTSTTNLVASNHRADK